MNKSPTVVALIAAMVNGIFGLKIAMDAGNRVMFWLQEGI